MTSEHPPVLKATSPVDLLALVPYLLGYHPGDSIVIVGLHDQRVRFAARTSLPEDPDTPDSVAQDVAAVMARQFVQETLIIGYGPQEQVVAATDAITVALHGVNLPVRDSLRVTDGRYFVDWCHAPCCPVEGIAFDPASSAMAAHATYAGVVALPDRESLQATVAPVDGPARTAMRDATDRAAQRMAALLHTPDEPAPAAPSKGGTPDLDEVVLRSGRTAVADAVDRYRQGGHLTDDEAAWLAVLLTHTPVRDHAVLHTDGQEHDMRLWLDLTRRAQPELVPGPATLLGYVAYRRGDGAVASIALGRALHAQPGYRLAVLLSEALAAGIPPSALDDMSTP
ncbi:DUF4192 domain-containing protein [Polymorphospora sp. NPDC050346]|uniref:DUF4192 domain-containing protein n=1 Tax=Polymorphospora sp. NPDC050346 TaxID=3155780 RepID=UPI0033F63772